MKLHADLEQRAVVHSRSLDWVASPMPGVERRMLERNGKEVARATSVVRYAAGSSFSAHTHSGGEEFLVLDGVFSDEMGDFPAGMYVRNPVGSRHIPSSAAGCTIFVKLWQMPSGDQEFVRTDTFGDGWQQISLHERYLPLHATAHEQVSIVELEAGATLPMSEYRGGAEFFVLGGTIADTEGEYQSGSWLRLPPGAQHQLECMEKSRFFRKTGHLLDPPPLP